MTPAILQPNNRHDATEIGQRSWLAVRVHRVHERLELVVLRLREGFAHGHPPRPLGHDRTVLLVAVDEDVRGSPKQRDYRHWRLPDGSTVDECGAIFAVTG